jgi:exodeoxyribonuclease VIII
VADRYQIMLDIETLGKSPGAVILSVGAAVMDMQELAIVDKAYWVLDIEMQEGSRSVDAGTVVWWMQQDDEARRAFRNIVPKTDCSDFVRELYDLFGKHNTKTPWANGTNFDLPILQNFIQDYDKDRGNHRGKTHDSYAFPWGYRHQDMRSLATVMAEVKPYDTFKASREMVAHNALADAECQAEYVLECKKWIRTRATTGENP